MAMPPMEDEMGKLRLDLPSRQHHVKFFNYNQDLELKALKYIITNSMIHIILKLNKLEKKLKMYVL